MPKPNLPTGTEIRNLATIDFEVGIPPDPIDTPEVFNTIDSGIPASNVLPLSAIQTMLSFNVTWSGSDNVGGAGIKNYDIYVSDNGGPYTLWTTAAETSATFTGVHSHQYSFYSWARDNVGNIEDAPEIPDTMTTVVLPTCLFCGDVNKDGQIDISDVILALRCALGLPIPYECLPCADINGDEIVDISDVILTLRLALGLDDWKPC